MVIELIVLEAPGMKRHHSELRPGVQGRGVARETRGSPQETTA